MKAVVVIQARMGSLRLPGKVLAPIGTHSVLSLLIYRLRTLGPDVTTVVATTDQGRDDVLADASAALGLPVFRGSESDVLDRYHRCAKAHDAQVVVRLTADNPLVDADLVLRALTTYQSDPAPGYVLTHHGGYPAGLSVEVCDFDALAEAARAAVAPEDREHVTKWIRERPQRWPHRAPRYAGPSCGVGVTIDTPADLLRVQALAAAARGRLPDMGVDEIMDFVCGGQRSAS